MRKAVIIIGILLIIIAGLSVAVVAMVLPSLAAAQPVTQGQGEVVVVEAPVVINQPGAETSSGAAVVLDATPVQEVESNAHPDWVTFQFENAPVAFEHPANWTEGLDVLGSRGSGVQFYSEGEVFELLSIVYLWDPKNDLDAWVAQRTRSMLGSGMTILAQEEVTLQNGQRAITFTMQYNGGTQGYHLFTTVGEDYFELAGPNIPIVTDIAATLRIG